MWLEEVERLLAATPVRRKPAGNGFVASAVLIPLYVTAGELWVLLMRRADSMSRHAGQYAFPGGVRTEGDEDEVATALRETHEELGIEPALVVVLGQLSDVWTPTGFPISPVVGAIPHPRTVRPASAEVEAVVQVPYSCLANPEVVEEQALEVAGGEGDLARLPLPHTPHLGCNRSHPCRPDRPAHRRGGVGGGVRAESRTSWARRVASAGPNASRAIGGAPGSPAATASSLVASCQCLWA
jgi:8-oxo-dGTP pyrophosphatase MutT (NUDIX family)